MKKYRKYIISFIISLLFCLIIFFSKNLFKESDIQQIYRILADTTFIVGILYLGFGALLIVSSEGVFDGLSYTFKSIANRFTKKEHIKYYEYKAMKSSKEKNREWYLPIIGILYLLIAILFTFLFNNV